MKKKQLNIWNESARIFFSSEDFWMDAHEFPPAKNAQNNSRHYYIRLVT